MTSRQVFPIISKYYVLYFAISLLVIIPGVISLAVFHLRPGIDFVGGTIITYSSNTKKDNTLRLPPIAEEERAKLTASLSASVAGYKETSFSTVGPVIGKELIIKTGTAILIAGLLIMVYLGFRFHSLKLGVCAIIATLHDVLVLLGVFSLLGHFLQVEVDLLFVTALLTIVSFSVHDTVVVYDRLRERRKRVLREPWLTSIDASVVETLTRSLRNAGAVILTLLSLFLLGGESLKWFAFALLVGTISGTYSSTFVAMPLLVLWENASSSLHKRGENIKSPIR